MIDSTQFNIIYYVHKFSDGLLEDITENHGVKKFSMAVKKSNVYENFISKRLQNLHSIYFHL